MRIVTYNTRGSLGMDNVRSTERIAEVLRSLSPDIICFQEIHRRLIRSGREDQPEVLSALLQRPFFFQSNLRIGLGGYGIGIATRGTIIARKEHLLPGGKEQRGALEVQLRDIGGFRRLTVFCTHWGLQEGERLQQAEALALHIKDAATPVIVCGDLNEAADGAAVRYLLGETGLHDADALLQRPTFDSNNPNVRIDYCLFSSELELRDVEVVPTGASDHLPVMADLDRHV